MVRLRPARMAWAKLLKRVFNIDMEHCPNCGGDLKIIAAIVERASIERILKHLNLEAYAQLQTKSAATLASAAIELRVA